jgi:hypothetical protein
LTKARVGLDLLRVVVGVKDIDNAPTSSVWWGKWKVCLLVHTVK